MSLQSRRWIHDVGISVAAVRLQSGKSLSFLVVAEDPSRHALKMVAGDSGVSCFGIVEIGTFKVAEHSRTSIYLAIMAEVAATRRSCIAEHEYRMILRTWSWSVLATYFICIGLASVWCQQLELSRHRLASRWYESASLPVIYISYSREICSVELHSNITDCYETKRFQNQNEEQVAENLWDCSHLHIWTVTEMKLNNKNLLYLTTRSLQARFGRPNLNNKNLLYQTTRCLQARFWRPKHDFKCDSQLAHQP